MGQVIALRQHPVNPEAVRVAREILDLTERGLMHSLIHIGVGPDGKAVMGICGEFAEDLEYATETASEGFSLLVGHKIEQQQTAPTEEALPKRMQRRKA